MGFTAQLQLLYPETRNKIFGEIVPSHTVWKGEEFISFGRVTRLEKLTDSRYSRAEYPPRQRAGICVVSILLSHLYERLAAPSLAVCAPEFVIYNQYEEEEGEFKQRVAKGTKELINCGLISGIVQWEQEKIIAHNTILEKTEAEVLSRLKNYHPVMDPPFLWESCTTMATQLEEAEASRSEAWAEVKKDSTSLALARAWRAYLREVGEANVRALFTFPYFDKWYR